MDFESEYSAYLREELRRLEAVAQAARRKGLDPSWEVEVRPADDVAGRVEGLVGPPGVAAQIRELAEKMSTQEIALQIAREIVHNANDGVQDREDALDQAIRTALAILTEGITAGPLEGIAQVKIKKNSDGSEYLAVYFAGPIRAAGGTEAALTVVVADELRRVLGLDRYKPSRDIIERYVEEVGLYKRVAHLQYPSTSEEVRLAAQNLPVEVTGEPTVETEVSGYRDLPGVETNRLRTGAILVLNDSVLGKAHKLAKLLKQLNIGGWEWLERRTPQKSAKAEDSQTVKPKDKFLEDIIAGRPVLAYPSRKGGFRIRYGRARNTGLAALGVHPATMVLLDNFVACGTQLIVERPGKGGIAMPVDSIHGPIIKLHDGSIQRVDSVAEAKQLRSKVARILFLGDLLIAFGEFRENNHLLVPAGYCPEWWVQEVKQALVNITPPQLAELEKWIDSQRLTSIIQDPFYQYPTPWQALALSSTLLVPLHPRFTYFWEDITHEQLNIFQQWVQNLTVEYTEAEVSALSGEITPEIEAILDKLCITFEKEGTNAIFREASPILHTMFIGEKRCPIVNVEDDKTVALSIIQQHWNIPLTQKGTFFVGARIGRPEKAKRREMKVPVHGLFPVGMAGGPSRDILKAEKKGRVDIETALRKCPKCDEIDMFLLCLECGVETDSVSWCPACKEFRNSPTCTKCRETTTPYGPTTLNLRKQLKRVRKRIGGRLPPKIKGVRGLMSKRKVSELPEKAALRARYDLYVYKDGTIRFDMTDAPLTHFTPKEIDVPVTQLQELGYNADIHGKPLTSEEQILELKPQDIIVPRNCANYLYRISQFLDDLLTDIYELDPYYRLKSPEDIIGHLVIGLAPHTSAGIIARVIGFTPLRVCYAHPFWHAAKRRNCLSATEELLIWDTEQEKLLKQPIGEIVENLLQQGAQKTIVDDYGTVAIENLHPHWHTISYNPDTQQPILQPIKHWIKGHSNLWIKVTTQSGRTITMTPDHSALRWNPVTQDLEKISAQQLRQGDQLPILTTIPATTNPPPYINILEELSKNLPDTPKFQTFKHQTRLRNAEQWMREKLTQYAQTLHKRNTGNQPAKPLAKWKTTHIIRNHLGEKLEPLGTQPLGPYWYKSIPLAHLELLEQEGIFQWNEIPHTAIIGMSRDDHTVRPYIPYTTDLLRLLGYYISEGYIRDERTCYQTNFSVPDPTIRAHVQYLIQTLIGHTPYHKTDNHQLVHTGRIHAYLLAYAWKIGKTALTKRIPAFVFGLPRDFRLHFLSAIIDGDGSIIPRSCRTTIYTGSKQLAHDYCLLLSTFGVFARIHQTRGGRFGQVVLERYEKLGTTPKETTGLFHVNIPGRENIPILEHLILQHKQKQERIQTIIKKGFPTKSMTKRFGENVVLDVIKEIEKTTEQSAAYCLEVSPVVDQTLYHSIINEDSVLVKQCDGDEDSILLALDALVNFSREFLPWRRGGTMDTPLVLSVSITPAEVDDEAHNMDVGGVYPLEFYERAQHFVDPKDVENILDVVEQRLGSDAECRGFLFSHPTRDASYGPPVTLYTKLKTMEEKVDRQLALGRRIAAVDERDMVMRLLNSHFLPDIFGNIRAYTSQKFRCTSCNTKFRRIPLVGVCTKCGGKLVLTVTKGGITKYIGLARRIAEEYDLPKYYRQRLELAQDIIKSLFAPEEIDRQQTRLGEFTEKEGS